MAWSVFPALRGLQGLHGAADLSRKLPGGRVGKGTELQWGPSVQGYVLVTRMQVTDPALAQGSVALP